MAVTVFPLTPAQLASLQWVFPLAVSLEVLLVGAALLVLVRPLRLAAARQAPLDDAQALAAAHSAHRLPSSASMAALLAGALIAGLRVWLMLRQGVPPDIGLAGAGVGLAAAILGAMATYTLAASAAAQALEVLGPRAEVAVHGTVRGKILVVGFGLNTIGLLLFAASGYVRYRADIDREYLAAAERAQQSVVSSSRLLADREVAEHVWLVTAAPSALLGPGGGVLARFGAGDHPFSRAAGSPGTQRVAGGWLVAARAPGGGLVVSWLSEGPLQGRRRDFWSSLASTGLLVYLAAAVLAWMAARAITIPFRTLGRAADRIAGGDLTVSPPSISQDEMGQLAADFRRMAQGLKALVIDVQAASAGVSHGAREAGAIGERVRHGALDQHQGVVAVQAAVEAMEGSVAQVSRGVGSLSDYVQVTTGAVGEMAAALEEVRKKGAELDRAMDSALADVDNLSSAGREAEATLGELEGLASHAGGTLAAVRASVSALERAAGESEANAALVAEMAQRSGGVVEETVHGIETLRAAVSDAHRRITALGRRSDDIDQVVDFISEVAGRTNLLSLNASIIASQAGQHGKAFAVVADQIRDLAAQIARSTKSIGDIIHAVREDVEATAALIDRGDALAVEGVQLARNSLEALGQIQRTTAQGRETAGAIRQAVDAHAGSSREVSQLVESVADGSRAVTAAVQLVGRSVAGVGSVSRSVNALAEQVSRALEDQSGMGRRQLESLSRLERMIADITRAVEAHNAATRRVRDTLGDLSGTTDDHERAVEVLSGVAERLGGRATALAERIDRFKV
ncbi:MAG: HAMP domain-containing protein [Anaeromyxobacter sp.]|nr:HAMP domain-containing protein [Anaeromyxobacter sp.]MBL0275790.1 HAMP domain-containing protein [Anaeromyxobacter sp.]